MRTSGAWRLLKRQVAGNAGLVAVLVVALAACAYEGGGIDNPLQRTMVWFSYVGGHDIKTACAPGAPDRYRLVYNGVWGQQVRVYDVGRGALRQFDVRVMGPGDIKSISLGDPLAPWRGATAAVSLTQARYDALIASFAESGMFAPPPVGLRLWSDDFYWTAASCRHGVFHFTAWRHPSPAFERIVFPRRLLDLDPTRVPFEAAHQRGLIELLESEFPDRRTAEQRRWAIEVGRAGLVGVD